MPERVDDETIEDSDILLRRILDRPNEWYKINTEDGSIRPSSVAFLDSTLEVSVFVERLTTHEKAVENYPDVGLVGIEAGVPRAEEHIVADTPEENDPTHRAICPMPQHGKKRRKAAAKIMAKSAKWIILPKSKRDEIQN